MPDFSPFAGVRYSGEPAALAALVAPPYDVIDEDERAALEAADAHNSVRLILPRDQSQPGDRYEAAATRFREWMSSGVLARDPSPRLYTYRMDFKDAQGKPRHTRGVLGALRLPEVDDHDVLPHERTMAKAKSDRLALLSAMRVNVDPIWGLTLGRGLSERLGGEESIATCLDPDGVSHALGAVDDPAAIAEVREIVASAPLVLADGHHRFETALNYRNQRRADGIDDPGAASILALVAELADDELWIEPIHRLVELPPGVDLRVRLADAFLVSDAGPNSPEGIDELVGRMRTERGLGLVDARGLALAVPRAEMRGAALAGEHPAVAATDAAIIEALVVPRLPGATWDYRHDARAVAALVEKGAANAAILCSPVSVAETRAAAVDRVRMPQKTTFFWPKPRTGMVFRTLD